MQNKYTQGDRKLKKIQELKQVFSPVFHEDFRAMLDYSAQAYQGDDAFIVKHKKGKKEVSYEHITFEEFRHRVDCLGTAFLQRDFQGKRIAIIGKNCCEWMLAYFSTLCGLGKIGRASCRERVWQLV